ncbi:DNA primase [Lachnospiraceae bacterium OttesenSCG-928-J05]|nr:DNA primase [Lachnospiraceae bacterium OttesenSCG-928-J05]
MFYPEEIIEEVRSRSDIVDVISGYVKLQKKGNTYFGLCPFHNEKTPSFSVSKEKGMFYCFGCGEAGNVITFIMKYENYTFVEALKFLAEHSGVELPEMEQSEAQKNKANKKLQILEINKIAANYFFWELGEQSGEIALTYLKKRGLSDEVIRRFGLGFAPKDGRKLYRYLKEKGYSDGLLMESGLFSADERNGAYCKFWNRVMFPIMDANSRVIGFGGRVMGEGEPKYLNSPETLLFDKSRNLYGLNYARKSKAGYLIVCEGYMDVIALQKAGFTGAVASLGTAFTSGQASLLRRYVDQVYLTYDSDDAGTRAALRALPIIKEAGISGKIIRMDPYKDPDELINKEGAEGFQKRIDEAENGFMYSLKVLMREYDMESPEGKTKYMNAVAERLTTFEEEIERNNYIEAVAKAYHVEYEDLKQLVKKAALRLGQAKVVKRPLPTGAKKKEREDGEELAQKILLTWIADDREVYESLKDYLDKADFTKEIYREIYELLVKQYEEGSVNQAMIINHFTDDDEHKEAAGIFNSKIRGLEDVNEQKKSIIDTLQKVKERSLKEQVKALDPTDISGLQEVMKKKQALEQIRRIEIKMID